MFVEQFEHTNHPVITEQRHTEDAARGVTGRLGNVGGLARVPLGIRDDDRLTGHGNKTSDPVAQRYPQITHRRGMRAERDLEQQFLRAVIDQKQGARLRRNDLH